MDECSKKNKIKEQADAYVDSEFDRFEIIAGVQYELSPGPTVNHQILLGRLHNMMYSTCSLNGVILMSPLDVYLDAEENHFQPDLIFISNDHLDIIKEQRVEGAPDLVVEILSPSTSTNDKIRKKAQYERFGVKEYWIVDPVHCFIDQFILKNGKFILHATYAEKQMVRSEQFLCVSVDTRALFSDLR